jgi:S-formylglutathione hydrolase FrmB
MAMIKKNIKILGLCFFMATLCIYCKASELSNVEVVIIDSRHYSEVFGEIRNFRVFLPSSYKKDPQKRYPVIYYYHGWSQRYFGSINSPKADEGDSNDGDNIANFVSKNDVIVVKPDGYNRSPGEEYYLRPYNIGPVENHRQFPMYFPELVEYIDNNYRTIPERGQRAISGLSMGGFMSFWIGGKYPDLISAIGNFCGSAEFVVGPKDFPVEYRHLDMYKNYAGVNVRLNYGDKDFIRSYHQDMNRVWTQVMDNYEYKIYDAGHSTCGLGEMFGFIMETFKNPRKKPEKWNHIDVYPSFKIWEYDISSDRKIPGFTVLENVNEKGFRSSVKEFLPDGSLMPYVNLTVTTPPVYEKNQLYIVNDIDIARSEITQSTLMSDNMGRLQIELNGSLHEIGINKKSDKPNICIASFEIENFRWATHKKDVNLSLKLLNKGMSAGYGVTIEMQAIRDAVKVKNSRSQVGKVPINETRNGNIPLVFYVEADSIEIAKFKLIIRDRNKNEWVEFIEVPIKKDLPGIKDFVIADGQEFVVAKAGIDTVTTFLGNGNGDGIANPGESIVILVKDSGLYRRVHLHTSDPYVNTLGINVRKSDYWSSYDHVGGSAKYSVPWIAPDCPEKYEIEFFAEYWLPDYPEHIIRQGTIKIEVNGKPSAPPQVIWADITGDNVVSAKIIGGEKVKARLISINDPKQVIEVELRDDGKDWDRVKDDYVYSHKIEEKGFGLFEIELEITFSSGNKIVHIQPGEFFLH